MPYHRDDGRFAALREEPVGGIDAGELLIEDASDRILVVGDDHTGYQLPRYEAREHPTAGILDVGNVMGSVVAAAEAALGIQLPWLSWLEDISTTLDCDKLWRCRVYAHRLEVATQALENADGEVPPHRWLSAAEVDSLTESGHLASGEQVAQWLNMWQSQVDEHGNPVTRSYGVPTTHVQYFSYNRAGNLGDTYRVGEFDPEGLPVSAAPLST